MIKIDARNIDWDKKITEFTQEARTFCEKCINRCITLDKITDIESLRMDLLKSVGDYASLLFILTQITRVDDDFIKYVDNIKKSGQKTNRILLDHIGRLGGIDLINKWSLESID